MKKIRVLILTTRFGGPYKWAKQFQEYALEHKLPVEIRIRSSFFSLLLSPFYAGKCDIVHTIQPVTFKLWRKPVLLNIRGNYKEEFNIRNLWAPLYSAAIRLADKVVVPSFYLKKKLGLNNADVIPNCIDVKKYPLKKDYSVKNKIKIVSVTSFAFRDKAEGVLSLVKILRKIDAGKPIELAVLGGGSYLKMIVQEVKKMGLPNRLRVKFLGKVDNVKDYLVKSDIFAYYSVHDNFPNSIIEAMACGLPVITNEVGAVKEMIEDGKDGFVAESDKEYFNKLNVILKCKRDEIGTNARKKVERMFSWQKIANEWVRVYKIILR